MTPEIQAALRAPFPANVIGKRPQPNCRNCSDARERVCADHRKKRCGECGQWMTEAHVHLDFVGHADITDRLLAVDPEWFWEPLAFDANGLPAFDANGGMWIRLTVAGVTRLGYGDAPGKRGGNAIKEVIGDALRNAAMRFGVGIDLWRKETDDEPAAAPAARPAPTTAPAAPPPTPTPKGRTADEIAAEAEKPDTGTERLRDLGREAEALGLLDATVIRNGRQGSLRELITYLGKKRTRANDQQHRHMHALWRDLGITDRDDRLRLTSESTGRQVTSSKDLSVLEADVLISELKARKAARAHPNTNPEGAAA